MAEKGRKTAPPPVWRREGPLGLARWAGGVAARLLEWPRPLPRAQPRPHGSEPRPPWGHSPPLDSRPSPTTRQGFRFDSEIHNELTVCDSLTLLKTAASWSDRRGQRSRAEPPWVIGIAVAFTTRCPLQAAHARPRRGRGCCSPRRGGRSLAPRAVPAPWPANPPAAAPPRTPTRCGSPRVISLGQRRLGRRLILRTARGAGAVTPAVPRAR